MREGFFREFSSYEQQSYDGRGDAQRPFLHGNEFKKTGARAHGRVARLKTTSTFMKGYNFIVYSSLSVVKGFEQYNTQNRKSAKLFSCRRNCHSLAGEGVGESQFRRGDRHCCTVYVCTLWYITLQRMASDVRSQFVLCMDWKGISREEHAFCSRWNLLTYPLPPSHHRHPNI